MGPLWYLGARGADVVQEWRMCVPTLVSKRLHHTGIQFFKVIKKFEQLYTDHRNSIGRFNIGVVSAATRENYQREKSRKRKPWYVHLYADRVLRLDLVRR